jgi:hypothetical protein
MKAKLFLVAAGVSLVAVALAILCLWLWSASRVLSADDLSVYLLGYTNAAGTVSAVLSVTNRSSLTFLCWQDPPVSLTGESNHLSSRSVEMLRPKGQSAFLVPVPPDRNTWRVFFAVQEDSYWDSRSFSTKVLEEVLRQSGFAGLAPQTAELTSPPISHQALEEAR